MQSSAPSDPQPSSSALEAGTSKKRKSSEEQSDSAVAPKAPKIHPFFSKRTEKKPEGSFQWLKPLGPTGSCLHGINLHPTASAKVAALDLDGTVIKSEFATKSAAAGKPPSWSWWRSIVPDKLKELYESGFAIVFISNQALKPVALNTWKEKIPLIGQALSDIPFRILAASQKDQYRKPMPGMWREIERIFKEEGVEIDKSASFFVGDAAGRQYVKAKGDFSSTDRKWAENIELPFFTPEEYFLKLPPHDNYTMPGFRASSLPNLPLVTPTSSPIIPTPRQQEAVLFVGYPCLGKSTFYRRYFQPEGYVHINQDTLKTSQKCAKVLQEAIKEGKSCVIDNTNRNSPTRKTYLDICKANNIKARCFYFTGSIELAWHNNLYRAFNMPPSAAAKEPERALLPYIAFSGFRDNLEEPTLAEGFSEIKKVNWVFEGTEEEKKHWLMWLQIDGK
ncbi:Bifunctional polynucleotide phosphatase/kinase [Psilocybe cubensis]|uniref:PNK3P-domain-containing protein n=2 Tax=Psilocybe cubensis TaxID=181762 RepID=A0A8H8CNN2_PSICU|nr:Bifunctional polynucleotide phosphatase/kinase [Psilocybe cubensis]KAH9483853.1 Bifunctional polynucleotide phosphatase/kinase [Psilocybe cubensis]